MNALFLKNGDDFDIIYLGCEDMEGLLIVIVAIVVVVCIISIFYAAVYNKFQDYIIRINEVESMIDNNLRSKYDTHSTNILFNNLCFLPRDSYKARTYRSRTGV